jgi:hypothetical protein
LNSRIGVGNKPSSSELGLSSHDRKTCGKSYAQKKEKEKEKKRKHANLDLNAILAGF